MSEEDKNVGQVYAAELKNGQLQIVDMTPYSKADDEAGSSSSNHILPDMPSVDGDAEPKYMQVLDPEKGLVQLDLVNLTLVRCEDGNGEQSFRLVSNDDEVSEAEVLDNTVTCIMESSEGEEHESQEEYVMVDAEQGPLMFLKSSSHSNVQAKAEESPEKPKLTPMEILEKAKALQKAKTELALAQKQPSRRGRKRRGDLPPPQELLSSPNFKLFLYSCKMCSFKCNAIKELTAHKATEHGPAAGGRWRGGAGGGVGGCRVASTLQCARCPFRGTTHTQLMKHVQVKHLKEKGEEFKPEVYLNSPEAAAADILVCGACGFESRSRPAFKKHIEEAHAET